MYQRFIFQFFWKIKKKKTEVTLSLILRFNLRLGGYSIWSAIFYHTPYMKIFTKGRQDYWRRSTTQLQCSSRSTRRSAIYKEDGDYSMTASGSTRRPTTTQLRRARGLVRPGATGYLTWHGSVPNMRWGLSHIHSACNYSEGCRTSRYRRISH